MKGKAFLLDINVLLALAWPNHVHHREAVLWFSAGVARCFRTCPLTQIGFVRISSNPAFTPQAVSPTAALELLGAITRLPGHEFWPDSIALDAGSPSISLTGHRQVVDLYLLKLAAEYGGVFATLDRGAAALARRESLPVALID